MSDSKKDATDRMLKLSVVHRRELATLQLEGRIIGPWVGELRRTCDQVLDQQSTLTVDLAGVTFVDRQGAVECRGLTARGVRFVNGSSFVTEQLKDGQP
jgi:hypothetical protein